MRRSLLPMLAGAVVALAALPAWAVPEEKAAEAPPNPAADEHKELDAAFNKARQEYYKALREWSAERKENPKLERKRPLGPEAEYVKKFGVAAEKHAGTKDASRFLISIVQIGARSQKTEAVAAMGRLLEKHIDAEKLSDLTFTLIYGSYNLGNEYVLDVMGKIVDGSPHDEVKSAFLYARGNMTNRSRDSTRAQCAAAVRDLNRSIELAPESRYGKMSKGVIFELENLQIGMTAPEIVGKDLDGVAFKLSDYRGKVVVIDFWGDW